MSTTDKYQINPQMSAFKLAETLEKAIAAAPEAERAELAKAMELYHAKFAPKRSDMSPLLQHLLGAIEEASDARC